MKLMLMIAVALVATTAHAGNDSARDGRYTCTFKENSVRATLATSPARLRVEDFTGETEGSALFRRDKENKWEEYVLVADSTTFGYYLRFAPTGAVTFHYCWSCAAYECKKD